MRYQHGLSTPDLSQTLPNLRNFLEHGLLVRCDQHFVSSSIAVPVKAQMGVSAAVSEMGYPCHTGSPERGQRKRASSDTVKLKNKDSPVPSYNATTAPGGPTEPSPKPLSLPLESASPLHTLTETLEIKEQGEREEGEGGQVEEAVSGVVVVTEQQGSSQRRRGQEDEETMEEGREMEEPGTTSGTADPKPATQPTGEAAAGSINGSLTPGRGLAVQADSSGLDLRCSVEQAEEIMGTEATGLGVGLRLGLGLGDGTRPEDYPCIPVDQAVAVECDAQVLGELDVASIEEFSRRIYALNENKPSFRRPRKNSDK
ncbi:hypothetical protein NHX12_010009 [Muraenolepis orangiensis]|uniref:Uncharacterized protein n=1 Tax=Muraenolepis orangiensis TaxID=630683 RepID=A0A9Q0DIW2_9TELE|nr:hypothetical protein NHX12_010009 [Muraenolepis orangiensis]